MTTFIRCRVGSQSHYVEAGMFGSLILRVTGDVGDEPIVRNTVGLLQELQADRRSKARWTVAFGFSPLSAHAVEFVLSRARVPSCLRALLSDAVMARPSEARTGLVHLVDDGTAVRQPEISKGSDYARLMSSLCQPMKALPAMQDDLIAWGESGKWLHGLGKGLVFWKRQAVLGMYDFRVVPCARRGWNQ